MKIHIIGICGKLNAGLALGLKSLGYDVSGSDKAFYPPMSTLLENGNLPIMVGYKSEHIDEIMPDLVAYGAAIDSSNPEVIRSLELGIKTITPTELIEQYVIKTNSIVVSGNYGKTTITGLLMHVFTRLSIYPSYMVGGEVKGYESVAVTDSDWSIVEGDEYPASKGGRSKFFYYNPKFLICTSIKWDHVDVFPTSKDYENNFKELFDLVPNDGYIIINSEDRSFNNLNLSLYGDRVIKSKPSFYHDGESIVFHGMQINPTLFGKHNEVNITLALTLLDCIFEEEYIDDNLEIIVQAINDYKGPSRRLELLFQKNSNYIFDDFAHNPEKFSASINALSEKFPDHQITAIIEPNLGNRTKTGAELYHDTFTNKNLKRIYIPRWKINALEDSIYFNENNFAELLGKTNLNMSVQVELDDDSLINKLSSVLENKNQLIVFMSSETFRGMAQRLIESLS